MESDAEVFKNQIKQLNTDIQKANALIASLRKEIEGCKKEIQERDDTIQDKVTRLDLNEKLKIFFWKLKIRNRKNVSTT